MKGELLVYRYGKQLREEGSLASGKLGWNSTEEILGHCGMFEDGTNGQCNIFGAA